MYEEKNMEISLCMIVRDEEQSIGRCLNSFKDIVDEIIIVDTGSQDRTKEIARKFTDKIYKFQWIDDFSAARNFAFSKASKDYILWVDADDVILDTEKKKIIELKKNLTLDIDAVSMNYVLQRDENNNKIFSMKRNRLVKRENNYIWIGRVHEYLDVTGNIKSAEIDIDHKKEKEYTSRNLKIYKKMIEDGVELNDREKYYYANELYDNGRYDDAISIYNKFLDDNEGWVEDKKNACKKLADCYRAKNNQEEEFNSLLKSFIYDVPSPDCCCRIGDKFISEENYNVAIYWFNTAIMNKPTNENMAFINHDCYTWIPYLQLAYCYALIGNYELANICNEEAARYKPDHPSIIYNRDYLKDMINN